MDEPVIGALERGGLGFSELPRKQQHRGGKVRGLVQRFETIAESGKGKPIKEKPIKKRTIPTKEARLVVKKLQTGKKIAPPPIATKKHATLQTIFHALKKPSHWPLKQVLKDIRAEFSVKSLLYLIPFSDIVTNTNSTILKLLELHRKHEMSSKKVLRILFRQAVIDTPLARDIITLAQAAVFLAKNIGSLAGTLGPSVLQSLRIALMTLGSASSCLSILFGGIQLSRGIKGLVDARKKLKKVREERADFSKELKDASLAHLLKDLHISNAEKEAHREMAKAMLRTAMGSFITAGGIIGLAAAFMGGVPAIGVAAASIALGCIATFIDLADKIHEKKCEKKRRELFEAALPDIKKAAENPSSWQQLSTKLGLKIDTPPEEREKVLVNYCFEENTRAVAPVNKSIPKKTLLLSSKMRPQTA